MAGWKDAPLVGVGSSKSASRHIVPPYADERAPGMIEPGNVEFWDRPIHNNPDGGYSTTRSMSFGTDKGETLVPTVVGGKDLAQFVRRDPYAQAKEHYEQTGEHLGIFKTPEDADQFSLALHNAQQAAGNRPDQPYKDKTAPAWADAPLVQAAQAQPQAPQSSDAPKLPPQYRAYQSLMKSPAEIEAMGHSRDNIMALPFAMIPGGVPMQAATGAISGAIADKDSPARGAVIGGTVGGVGGLAAKGLGALYHMGANLVANKTLPADQAAQRILSGALGRDRVAPDVAEQTMARFPDKEITAMDAGGSNTARLARNVRTLGGEGGEQIDKFLAERHADQHARVLNDIRQTLADGSDAHGMTQGLITQRETAADPLYKQAFEANQNIASPEIDRMLETPAGKQALADARVLMQNDRSLMGVPDAELREQATEAGQAIPKGGVASGLKLRTLHYVKMALDDQVGAALRANEGTRARILTGLKKDFVKALDEADVTAKAGPNSTKAAGGLYKQARAAFSGPSQSMDAIEAGGDFLKMRPEEIKAHLADLGESDQDFYRVGAARTLQDRVLKAGDNADAVGRVFGNKYLRSQIDAAFGPGSTEKFAESMTAEKMAAGTSRFVRGGSQTADKAVDLSDPNAEIMGDIVEGGIRHGIKGAVGQGLKHAGARASAFLNGMTPPVRDELARLLVQTTPGSLRGIPGGNVPVGAVNNNWGTAVAPFMATETLKRLLESPPVFKAR